ncbi:MAG: glutamyl-tRNA amidotransferase [Epsilonproteobacteria bacterium]|nr:glutamyl-tRNA amidotransferase [Campylobacterota bacterium]NPA88762.1 glutamyl-tRNA amidotransferase [Campylobacterota bacterium]
MDKPVPGWLIIVTILILVGVSVGIYFWLKSLK